MSRHFVPWALVSLLAVAPVAANAIDSDVQEWTLATAQGHVAPRMRLYGEVQPRLALTPETGIDRLLLRGAVGFDLLPNVAIWAGYAWTPTFQPSFAGEHRPFQQLTVSTTVLGGALLNRTRFEQRFISGADLSLRLRHMVRYARPFVTESPWLWVVYDELFVNANAPEVGPARGIDQNRLFVGINRVVGPAMLELGYLLDTIVRPDPKPLLQRSIVVTGVAFNLP